MGHETDLKAAEQSKIIMSSATAALFEFVSKLLIERTFFQNNAINPMILIYIVNDLIHSYQIVSGKATTVSLYK